MARGTVLIADDDTAIRTVLNQALARAGYARSILMKFISGCLRLAIPGT